MNKYFFTVLLIVVLSTSNSQAQFTYGVRLGLNSTGILDVVADIRTKFGFQIGALVDYTLNDKFSIEPKLLFVAQGYKDQARIFWDGFPGGGVAVVKKTVNLNYIQIPIHVCYRPYKRLLLRVGPYFGFAIDGKIKLEDSRTKGKSVHKLNFGVDDYYGNHRIFDCGLNVGGAVQFSNLQVGLEVNQGFVSIIKPSVHYNNVAYIFGFTLYTTYMFR